MYRAEMFGRLYSCGFEIIDHKSIDHSLFFVAKKVKIPHYDNNPTYAPIISLNRIGKNGKLFKVYKLRTMHPYSEYLQGYVYNKNKLQEVPMPESEDISLVVNETDSTYEEAENALIENDGDIVNAIMDLLM